VKKRESKAMIQEESEDFSWDEYLKELSSLKEVADIVQEKV